jgi:hypothetical protein
MVQEEAKAKLLELGQMLGYTMGYGTYFISTYANSLYEYSCGCTLNTKSKGRVVTLHWETNAPKSGNENNGFQAHWLKDGKFLSTPYFEDTNKLYEVIKNDFEVARFDS